MVQFSDQLLSASKANKSLVCVGLDPDPDLMPIPNIVLFNRSIVDVTKDIVCAYKPNLGFYEAQGSRGIRALEETLEYIRKVAPGVMVIGDSKRGDVGSTSAKYAQAMFDTWGFDAVTVNGYMGRDSIEPFLEYTNKGIFILCKTSNLGAEEFQDKILVGMQGNVPFYQEIAHTANLWNKNGNIGLVVGATHPLDLGKVRTISPNLPILLPGIGTQLGDLEESIVRGIDAEGRGLIASCSRSILYASNRADDFEDQARLATQSLRGRINEILTREGVGW